MKRTYQPKKRQAQKEHGFMKRMSCISFFVEVTELVTFFKVLYYEKNKNIKTKL